MTGQIVYLLCGATSFVCTALLFRGYLRSRSALLFWNSLGFLGLALNNLTLYIDFIVYPEIDLSVIRALPALLGLIVMIYGLIRDTTA